MKRICIFNTAYRGVHRMKFDLIVDGNPIDENLYDWCSCYLKGTGFYVTIEEGIPVPILRDDNSREFRYFVQPGDAPCSILQNEKTGLYSFRDFRGTRTDTALLDTRKDEALMRSWIGRITHGSTYSDLVKEYKGNSEIKTVRIGRDSEMVTLILAPEEEPRLCILNPRAPFSKIREAVRKAERYLSGNYN